MLSRGDFPDRRSIRTAARVAGSRQLRSPPLISPLRRRAGRSRRLVTRSLTGECVVGGTRIARPRVLIDAGPGTLDGFRVDIHGNLWYGWVRQSSTVYACSTVPPIFACRNAVPMCFGGLGVIGRS